VKNKSTQNEPKLPVALPLIRSRTVVIINWTWSAGHTTLSDDIIMQRKHLAVWTSIPSKTTHWRKLVHCITQSQREGIRLNNLKRLDVSTLAIQTQTNRKASLDAMATRKPLQKEYSYFTEFGLPHKLTREFSEIFAEIPSCFLQWTS